LNTKVDKGVWKGCYTTKNRAKAVIHIEDYIKSQTDINDNVLFLDWTSFEYLMSEGQPCTPTTLDPMTYSYGVNKPNIMYKYFEMVGKIPNKIVYIDYGRDNTLSIEDDKWKFNDFVAENYDIYNYTYLDIDTNYDCESNEESGHKYRVFVYRVIDEDSALESVRRQKYK